MYKLGALESVEEGSRLQRDLSTVKDEKSPVWQAKTDSERYLAKDFLDNN